MLPKLFVATCHIPSIGARKGNFILDDGSGTLCVMHEEKSAGLTSVERSSLLEVPAPGRTRQARPRRRLERSA